MGRRGPKPTPKEILRIRGSWRGKEGPSDVKAPPGAPDKPEWLKERQSEVWDKLIPLLAAMGILSKVDCNALARYCQFIVRWIECEEWIDKYGTTYPQKSKDGTVLGMAEFPQVKRSQSLSLALSKLEAEFGMTPSARARLTAPPEQEKPSGKSRFFAS